MISLSASRIFTGDALTLLSEVPEKSVQLCVTSPPYNIGKSYEKDDPMRFEEYVTWIKKILQKIEFTLADGGSLCLQVGSYVKDGNVMPLDYEFFPYLIDLGMTFRNRIIWRYNFGYNAVKRLSGRYEVILWFTKGSDYKFNLDPIRVKQLYPGKRHSAKKGEKAGKPSGNPKGKNPSDYWEFDPQSAFFGEPVWNIPNVKANHPEKVGDHPCQFPSELAERCILAMTDKDDVVLDPFVGTGTSVICADLHQRVGLGFEIIASYADHANERLKFAREGKLVLRQSGREPRVPKAGEKVSVVPEEWAQASMEGEVGETNEEAGKKAA